MSDIITRFAPSPTGFLHIGGARTALFNWLFARNKGGKFLLRIEDTDKKRSTDEAIEAILKGLEWLGLDWDDDVVYQSQRETRHKEIANKLLNDGNAYRCYCSAQELEEMRSNAQAEGKPFHYNGKWRDIDASEAPEGIEPVVRIKAPKQGDSTIKDGVQSSVTVANSELDDFIILRSDGTPTYMLAVVVDDHDMGVTNIIRGDDHLTNAFRQKIIYDALGWDMPSFSHLPLIHGQDGAKLSKRHGALGIEAYRDMGYLPEALRNYLLRLGWSHGDDEIISTEQAIEWFNLEAIGKSPSRIDFDKMTNVNAHYIREADNSYLVDVISPLINMDICEKGRERLTLGMEGLKERAKNIVELAQNAAFYIKRPVFTEKARKILDNDEVIENILPALMVIKDWTADTIETVVRTFAEANDIKLGKVAQPLRAALCGSTISPGIFDVLFALGKDESLKRLNNLSENDDTPSCCCA